MPSFTNLIRNGYDSGCVSLHTPHPLWVSAGLFIVRFNRSAILFQGTAICFLRDIHRNVPRNGVSFWNRWKDTLSPWENRLHNFWQFERFLNTYEV